MSIELKQVTHVYSQGSAFERKALDHVNLRIEDGEFIALCGHTGCGKSTLVQHLNGLLQPTEGQVLINGEDINGENVNRKRLRQSVGLVFQYPEYQLFEETVAKDIAFGPKNMGLSEKKSISGSARLWTTCISIMQNMPNPPRLICLVDRCAV